MLNKVLSFLILLLIVVILGSIGYFGFTYDGKEAQKVIIDVPIENITE